MAEDLQIVETELAQAPGPSDMNLPADFAQRLSKQLPNLREALETGSEPATTVREILRGMIDKILLEPTPGKESRIDCPWEVTVTGPIQAVLGMPDVPSKGTSPFVRRGMVVPLA